MTSLQTSHPTNVRVVGPSGWLPCRKKTEQDGCCYEIYQAVTDDLRYQDHLQEDDALKEEDLRGVETAVQVKEFSQRELLILCKWRHQVMLQ